MMAADSELDLWRSAWTAAVAVESPAPFDVRAAGLRQERRLRIRYLLNLAVAAALAALPLWVLRDNWRVEAVVWAAVVWITTLIATAFEIWNWRTLWRTAAHSVTEYAGVYEARCHATLRAVRFGYAFLALQLAISLPWLTLDLVRGEMTAARYIAAVIVLGTFTAIFILWFRVSRRRALAELAQVKDFLLPEE